MIVFCILTLILTSSVAAHNPAARLLVTQQFFNYGKDIGIQVLNKEIKGLSIPDVSGSAGKSVTSEGTKSLLHYELSHISITAFTAVASKAKIETKPPHSASFTATDISAAVHMNYHIKVGKGWLSVSKSGSIEATASGVSFSLAIGLTQKNDRPFLTAGHCSANIAHLGIKFHGDVIDSILNLFESEISGYVKGKLTSILCGKVSQLISEKANGVLQGIPVSIGLFDGFNIDYSMTSNPGLTTSSAYIDLRGEIWYTGHHEDSQIPQAHEFGSVSCDTMLCILIDAEEIFGSLGYAAQVSGIINIDLTSQMLSFLPGSLGHYLDCACTNGACIGALIPQITSKCTPGSTVKIHLTSSTAPTAHVNSTGAFVSFGGEMAFIGVNSNGTNTPLFIVDATMTVATPSNLNFHGWTISGEVHVAAAQLNVKSSNVGDIDQEGLNQLWQLALIVAVEGKLNQITSAGITLPSIPYFTVETPNLHFLSQHFLQLKAGLNYTGPIKFDYLRPELGYIVEQAAIKMMS